MNRNFWIAAFGLLAWGLTGCVPTETDRQASVNEAEINAYAAAKGLTPIRTPDGLFYQFVSGSATPQTHAPGDRLTFAFKEYRLIDGAAVDSSQAGRPLYYSWGDTKAYHSDTSFVASKAITKGLVQGLQLMPVGSRAMFLLPASLAYGNTGQLPYVLPGFTVRNDVTLLAVETEIQRIEKYFSQKGLVPETSLDNGFRMTYTNRPTGGDSLKAGSSFKINYAGSLTNGKVFDSGTLTVNMSNPGLVTGFTEALRRLTVGQSATVGFPSALGYGAKGSLPRIPPYAPLIFTVSVIEKVK